MVCTWKKSTVGEVLSLLLCYTVPGTEDRFKAKAPWHKTVREAMGKCVAHTRASGIEADNQCERPCVRKGRSRWKGKQRFWSTRSGSPNAPGGMKANFGAPISSRAG